ncbi:MAG: gamma-glutamylcyclotransferase [Sphingobacteriaceae bacterium]|nr:gamma-glutamylcyclotransferase [Sphingobacteriaceae bacterium]
MERLFIYGTLLQSDNTFGRHLKNNSKYLGKGHFRGKLYNIGEYPGAIYLPGDSFVFGSIVLLNEPEETLKVMDEYEGYGDKHTQPNEFIRQTLDIETDTGFMKCWVYLYNLPVNQFQEITKGNYIDFLAE